LILNADTRPSRAKVLVILAIGGAALFGVYLAYLAWSNDSFPAQQRPFGDYATVTSTSFNGTEVSFDVKWLSADYLPLYAQVTSATTNAANTPVCGLGLKSISAGQVTAMPFGISKPSPVVTDVELSIAIRSVSTGDEFTIVYSAGTLLAQQGDVLPSGISCQQRAGGM
jgi:hypothetical protein